MLFQSVFQTLVAGPKPDGTTSPGVRLTVELKNGIEITGNLQAVDQFLNMRLTNVAVNPQRAPQLTALTSCFIRGSVVRYVQLPPSVIDTDLLTDATRRDAMGVM